jgi:PPOX class probable F420-dependent enzyme
MSARASRAGAGLDRLLDRIRHQDARSVATTAGGDDWPAHLAGHRYGLVVTYRRDGQPVATPVWFGVAADRVYFRTDAATAKVKRIRADSRASIGPCGARGRPLGPAVECSARVLSGVEAEEAERAIRANYGLGRCVYDRLFGAAPGARAYVELSRASHQLTPER